MDQVKTKRVVKENLTKDSPEPKEVIAARKAAMHSTWQAANTIYISTRQWQKYESGKAPMPAASFELYRIKTGQF